jgi:hypothetical protein
VRRSDVPLVKKTGTTTAMMATSTAHAPPIQAPDGCLIRCRPFRLRLQITPPRIPRDEFDQARRCDVRRRAARRSDRAA